MPCNYFTFRSRKNIRICVIQYKMYLYILNVFVDLEKVYVFGACECVYASECWLYTESLDGSYQQQAKQPVPFLVSHTSL